MAYLNDHPEVWREALAKAHLIDEQEGQRKERQRLRRAQLAARRSVYPSDNAKTPIEKTQENPQPKGD
jgi:hypothetical protein